MIRPPAYLVALLAVALAGCSGVTPPLDQNIKPIVGPPPMLNTTPMRAALACMREQRGARNLRIGVNDFVDGTGVMEGGTQNSHAITQRPDLMMTVALAAAGASLVNRSSVNVAEWEMKEAMEKKLGDGHPDYADGKEVPFRPVRAGIILGSNYYVTGAVTELNWNIDSGVAEGGAYSTQLGRRTYRISIAVDVVVTNTQTTQIVFAKSFKKQLVGVETNLNFFRFFDQNTAAQIISLGTSSAAATVAQQALELFDANLDEKSNEPTQTALRWVIELAAFDVMRTLKHTDACDHLLPPNSLGNGVPPGPTVASAFGPTGADLASAGTSKPASTQPGMTPEPVIAQASRTTDGSAPTARPSAESQSPAPLKPPLLPATAALPPPAKPFAEAKAQKPVKVRSPKEHVARRSPGESVSQTRSPIEAAADIEVPPLANPVVKTTPAKETKHASPPVKKTVTARASVFHAAQHGAGSNDRKRIVVASREGARAVAPVLPAVKDKHKHHSEAASNTTASGSKSAATKQSAPAEKSNGDTQSQAESGDAVVPIRAPTNWMAGSVPALGTQLSQAEDSSGATE